MPLIWNSIDQFLTIGNDGYLFADGVTPEHDLEPPKFARTAFVKLLADWQSVKSVIMLGVKWPQRCVYSLLLFLFLLLSDIYLVRSVVGDGQCHSFSTFISV